MNVLIIDRKGQTEAERMPHVDREIIMIKLQVTKCQEFLGDIRR